jgi:uncharacterized protein YgiM (DUF1202 family)
MKIIYTLSLLFVTITIFSQSYVGTITKQVNFREGASTDNSIISSLKPNTQVFIISLETENDYYNIIVSGKLAENRRKIKHIKKEKYAKN